MTELPRHSTYNLSYMQTNLLRLVLDLLVQLGCALYGDWLSHIAGQPHAA